MDQYETPKSRPATEQQGDGNKEGYGDKADDGPGCFINGDHDKSKEPDDNKDRYEQSKDCNLCLEPKTEPSIRTYPDEHAEREKSSCYRHLQQLRDLDAELQQEKLIDGIQDVLRMEDLPEDAFPPLVLQLCRLSSATKGKHAFAIMGLLNTLLSSPFIFLHVQAYVKRSTPLSESDDGLVMVNLATLFGALLDRFPAKASESLGIALLSCREALNRAGEDEATGSVGEKLRLLEDRRREVLGRYDSKGLTNAARDETAQMNVQPAPDDFRLMSTTITEDDVHRVAHPFLRPNVVNGRFVDVEHYLDVHFRLLREDFVAPLRDGLDTLLSTIALGQTKDFKVASRDANIHVYEGTRIVGFCGSHTDGITYGLRFDQTWARRVNWETSKRLLHGSLLCLSSDYFATMYLAVIVESNPTDLCKGLLKVQFVDQHMSLAWDGNDKRHYIMVESPTFYQAYQPVLRSLQSLDQTSLPFQRYLVECSREIDQPRYLEKNYRYDLSPLLSTTKWDDIFDDCSGSVSMMIGPENWPSAEHFRLDEAQYAALKLALTKEMAIIQGPPGTGKTFLGLKIVRALLANESIWRKSGNPILVVCYTNHALDQFLEGILSGVPCMEIRYSGFYTNVSDDEDPRIVVDAPLVRVGGQSKSTKLMACNLNRLRRTGRRAWPGERKTMHKLRTKLELQKSEINEIESKVCMTERTILGKSEFFHMNSNHEKQLQAFDDSHGKHESEKDNGPSAISSWLLMEEEFKPEDQLDATECNTDKMDSDVAGEGFEPPAVYSEGQWRNVTNNRKHKRIQYNIINILQSDDAMDVDEADAVQNIWRLSSKDRWRLYRYWLAILRDKHQQRLFQLKASYASNQSDLKYLQREIEVNILKSARVIGMTTSGAAKYMKFLQEIQPRIVIVEEAAEVLEAHIVSTLTKKCEHLILIGDHQQLRPSTSVYKLATRYHLDVSLFERLIRNGVPHVRLTQQHRMRPEVAALLSPHIYVDLMNDPSVEGRPHIRGVGANVFFVEHDHDESQGADSTSRYNEFEARFSLSLANYLLLQGYPPNTITILSTYAGQLHFMKDLMKDQFSSTKDVICTVVDNYQGEENDIIILSLVRSSEDGNVGFLRVDNRVCVALSRARNALYCVGNFALLADASELWRSIVASLRACSAIGRRLPIACHLHPETSTTVDDPDEFMRVAPDGGCQLPCGGMLACGIHPCTKSCHPYDHDHTMTNCLAPCEKKLCDLGHICGKPCYVECGLCRVPMSKVLPVCGHTVDAPCSTELNKIVCDVLVGKELPCNHYAMAACGKDINYIVCQMLVKRMLKCGHFIESQCNDKATYLTYDDPTKLTYDDPTKLTCSQPCNRMLTCGHPCTDLCNTRCGFSPCWAEVQLPRLCGHLATTTCHTSRKKDFSIRLESCSCDVSCKSVLCCGHRCGGTCGECHEGRVHRQCDQQCSRLQLCGHPCQMPCWSSCPPCQQPCEATCEHGSSCGSPCGAPCRLTCVEPCGWQCPHYICSHPCKEMCDRPPCDQPCSLPLDCGHPCGGLCGEPCPPHCRICSTNSSAFDATFTVSWEKEDCRLILLEDCGHMFEVKFMDRWMVDEKAEAHAKMLVANSILTDVASKVVVVAANKEALADMGSAIDSSSNETKPIDDDGSKVVDEIVKIFGSATDLTIIDETSSVITINITKDEKNFASQKVAAKCCPKCNTVIQRSRRYGDQIKKFRGSLLEIKKIIFDDAERLQRDLGQLIESKKASKVLATSWMLLKKEANTVRGFTGLITLQAKFRWLTTIDTQMSKLTSQFSRWSAMDNQWEKIFPKCTTLSEAVQKQLKCLMKYIKNHLDCTFKANEDRLHDIDREILRFTLLVCFACSLNFKAAATAAATTSNHPLFALKDQLLGNHPFTYASERESRALWQLLAREDVVGPCPPKAEVRLEEVDGDWSASALVMCQGRWNVCSVGHRYSVGPREKSGGKCISCHTLVPST